MQPGHRFLQMKKATRHKKNYSATACVLCIVTAVVVVCAQFFVCTVNNSNATAKCEDTEQQSADAAISLPTVAQQHSPVHVASHHPACIFEIRFIKERAEVLRVIPPLRFGRFCKMLFQRIISPNAP